MKNVKQIAQFLFLLCCSFAIAQAPQRMSYQAVVRNASGNLVANANVGIRISILQGSASGTAVYIETHTVTTNENGLATLQIGGGNVQSGNFSTINWGNGTYFIQTETDPNGGSNYSISGTSQLLSVPYALYAENTKNQGRTTIYLTGDITDAEAAQRVANEAGPHTESIYITNTTALTNISIDKISDLRNIVIENNSALQSVTMNTVKTTYESFSVLNCPNLLNLTLNNYEKAGGTIGINNSNGNPAFAIAMPNLVKIDCFSIVLWVKNISLPSLTTIATQSASNSSFVASESINLPALTNIKGAGIGFNTAAINIASLATASSFRISGNLSTVNLNALNSGNIEIYNALALTQLTIPNLTSGGIHATYSNLVQISLPNLTTLDAMSPGFNIENNSHLTQLSFPMLSNITNYANILLRNNAFPSSEVNNILHQMLPLTPSGYSLYISGQTPHAPPTGQGIIDKQTLVSHGNHIFTD